MFLNMWEGINITVEYKIKNYTEKTQIFDEDEELNYVGIILNGAVHIRTTTIDGFEFEISTLKKGEMFGDALIFNDDRLLPGYISVDALTSILFIEKLNFKKLLSTNKDFLFKYLEYQAKRNTHQHYMIKLLGQPSIREKILFFLKEEIKKTKSKRIILNMTKENLAVLMGLNRPSLSRELMRLKKEGKIDYDRYSITYLE